MNSSSPAGKALSLRLDQGSSYLSDSFQLNRQSFSNLNNMIITTFETEHTVTLVCNGLVPGGRYKRLDILEALKSGLLELVESGKEDGTRIEPRTHPGSKLAAGRRNPMGGTSR